VVTATVATKEGDSGFAPGFLPVARVVPTRLWLDMGRDRLLYADVARETLDNGSEHAAADA